MRRIAMTGLVAIAAVLGSAVPAVTASAATTPAPALAARPLSAPRPAATVSVGLSTLGSRISCASPSVCLAVGTNTGKSGNQSIPVAEVLHGTAWKSVAVKAPKGAAATALTGVSCKSATYCLVVGGYSDSAQNTLPAAWTWNGSALTPVTTPPLPRADSLAELSAVSCVAVKSCVVIGSALGGSTTAVQLVWTWNGSKWALRTATLPGAAASAELGTAHCFSLTSCVVAGISAVLSTKGTLSENLALASWNGKAFTLQQAPAPAGLTLPVLADLSCSSAHSCAVVGSNVNLNASATTTSMFAFAEVWNGNAWSVTKWTAPRGSSIAALLGVSCTSAASCVAVGAQGSQKSLKASALSFNGSKWSARSVPSAGKGLSSDFEDVSCTRASSCVAIGEYGPSTATSGKPLAGYWNGSAWKLKAA